MIIALIYLERMSKATNNKFRICTKNWRYSLFACMMLSSKIWDDFSLTNYQYSNIFSNLGLKKINQLEIELLLMLEFSIGVSSEEYYQYHNSIHQLITVSNVKRVQNKLEKYYLESTTNATNTSLSLTSTILHIESTESVDRKNGQDNTIILSSQSSNNNNNNINNDKVGNYEISRIGGMCVLLERDSSGSVSRGESNDYSEVKKDKGISKSYSNHMYDENVYGCKQKFSSDDEEPSDRFVPLPRPSTVLTQTITLDEDTIKNHSSHYNNDINNYNNKNPKHLKYSRSDPLPDTVNSSMSFELNQNTKASSLKDFSFSSLLSFHGTSSKVLPTEIDNNINTDTINTKSNSQQEQTTLFHQDSEIMNNITSSTSAGGSIQQTLPKNKSFNASLTIITAFSSSKSGIHVKRINDEGDIILTNSNNNNNISQKFDQVDIDPTKLSSSSWILSAFSRMKSQICDFLNSPFRSDSHIHMTQNNINNNNNEGVISSNLGNEKIRLSRTHSQSEISVSHHIKGSKSSSSKFLKPKLSEPKLILSEKKKVNN